MAKILICDDAVFMRMTIKETLESAGHEIVGEAENPADAIAMYEKLKPDIVTMDILMQTSGVEGVRDLLDIDPDAKIVIISVLNEQQAEVIEAIKLGAKGIITKPINRAALVLEVNRVLNA